MNLKINKNEINHRLKNMNLKRDKNETGHR